ncbi:uncharacterized protein LOC120209351 [Hibiscus syriacus]|uniref:uncharacterized protein LOC120209351 n=1 Tax=Hibiscus syriacus TaxID=106335 RepID=UPI001923C01B|nr:uncharacterized protein LOC120209351 [Hibiscus syriacus]
MSMTASDVVQVHLQRNPTLSLSLCTIACRSLATPSPARYMDSASPSVQSCLIGVDYKHFCDEFHIFLLLEPRVLGGGSGVTGPLPRVFISELHVDQLSPKAQVLILYIFSLPTREIIRKYTEKYGCGNKYAALASALVSLTWEKPLYSEFQQLEGESEYAAWTFVNGYALNHVTISTHRLKSNLKNIKSLNQFIEKNGFKLNYEGGVLKGSPDGLLLQSSTVADSIPFSFSDGINESVPCSYIEFAERLVLPQYKNQPESEIKESHRRDGFEVGNADKIFESISKEQLTRRA